MRILLALLAVTALGCTALPDGDVPRDGAARQDASTMDASLRDAQPSDAQPSDAQPSDASPADAALDGGVGDACVPETYYPDCDGDRFGAPGLPYEACPPGPDVPPEGCAPGTGAWALAAGDCNDFDGMRYPGAEEECNGVDMDCDAEVDALDADAESACGGTVCAEGGCLDSCAPPDAYIVCDAACQRIDSPASCGDCGLRCLFGCRRSGVDFHCEPPSHLAAGGDFTCAGTITGGVSCWGTASFGAAPGQSDVPARVPLPIPAVGSVLDLDMGAQHQCVAFAGRESVSVYCWGLNTSGELGVDAPDYLARPVPLELPDLEEGVTVVQVEVGDGFTCVLTSASDILCWGRDIRDSPDPARPYRIEATVEAEELAAGADFVCARGEAGGVSCVGANPGSSTPAAFRPTVWLAPDAGHLAAGRRHVCWTTVDMASRRVLCMGDNSRGQIDAGPGAPTRFSTGQEIDIDPAASADTEVLEAGDDHTCLLTPITTEGGEREVTCWGANEAGQTGQTADASLPASGPGVAFVTDLTAPGTLALGRAHSCVSFVSGPRACWGRAEEGQFGWLLGAAPPPGGAAPAENTRVSF